MAALTAWTRTGLPDDPGAWLYRVAHNRSIGDLRRKAGRLRILRAARRRSRRRRRRPRAAVFRRRGARRPAADALRLLRRRHSPRIAAGPGAEDAVRLQHRRRSRCGSSPREANVHKRLARARERLREAAPDLETPPPLETLRVAAAQRARGALPALQRGLPVRARRAGDPPRAVRRGDPAGHAAGGASRWARSPRPSRCSRSCTCTRPGWPRASTARAACCSSRSRTGRSGIASGCSSGRSGSQRSASGEVFSRYHAEAGIAAEHCLAPSFAETRWKEIADLYAMLERIAPSPLHTLNRAVAVAEWQGPEAGLALLQGLAPPAWLSRLLSVGRRPGRSAPARRARRQSPRSTGSGPWARRPRRRCETCSGAGSPSPARTDGARTGCPLVPTNQLPRSSS